MPLLNTEYYLLFGNFLFYATYKLLEAYKSHLSSTLTSLNNTYLISQNSVQALHGHLFEFRSLSSM